jgi:hypothetical protein
MSIHSNNPKSRNRLAALLAAFGMTLVMGLLIVAVGLNALLFNPTGVAKAAGPASQASSADQANVQQLQDLVAQYQSRETQYKSELQQAGDQLAQANRQLEQYQQLVQALINAGVIQISSDGRITLGRGAAPGF